jgi:biopolymer transport protein ExbB/TolQ
MATEKLRWGKMDIEHICGFTSKKMTGVNGGFAFLVGLLMTIAFFAALWPFAYHGIDYVDMFFHGGAKNRSTIPYYTMLATFWALAILLIKWQKLRVQRKALTVDILPRDPNFVLSPATVNEILNNIYTKVDEPKRFMLFDRVERSLSNLKNLGNVSDVAGGLSAQAENDDNYLSSTYTLTKSFIWAIPVLGFIGTVLGLAQAVGGFGLVVSSGKAGVDDLKSSLGGVTSGLAVAFETTLIALVAALIVQLLLSWLQNKEEFFLDECSDYCHKNIISKLRTVNLREEVLPQGE